MSAEEEQPGFLQRYWDGFTSNLYAFGKFLYNSEDGTIMGRDGGSWLRISIFYLGYYLFLAALFAVSITATLAVLDPNIPYFQTRLQYPGVTILPRTEKFDPAALDIRFTKSKSTTYEDYVNGITELLKPYKNQTGEGFTDCNPGTMTHQTFGGDVQSAKSCRINPDTEFLSDCTTGSYGYPDKPCIFVRLNKVINWKPVPFMSLQDDLAKSPESGAIPLSEHLANQGIAYKKEFTYVTCSGKTKEDQVKLGRTVYKPEGINIKYFPYFGKQLQKNYLSPMVSVQFDKIEEGVEIKATCKVYSRNMIDLARINVGYVDFKVKIDP